MTAYLQILTYGIMNGALYALIALGLSLIFGVMSYLNVAHGALIMIGAYGSFWLFHLLKIDPFLSIFLTLPLFLIAGLLLFMGLFKWLLEFSEHEKIKNSLLISFGLLLILPNSAILLWTPDERGVTTWYSGRVLDILGVRLPYLGLATVGIAIGIIVALHLFLTRTYFGKAIRAVAQDHEAAGLMGINVTGTYVLSFAVGIALAAVPGALVSLQGFNPEVAFELTNKALIVVILGGVGSIGGCLLAGLLLGAVEAAGVFVIGAAYRECIGLILFVLILMVRPQGVLGKKT
ncbi:MAG: branched-chain amino acid ABC transporter permease [Pseudomonadota bacterium]